MSGGRASCVDSSVAIAAFGEWHELHEPAVEALAGSPDGLVGLTAKAAGAELLSLDARAAETYARLGVDHRLAL